jgi:hypothetical protein
MQHGHGHAASTLTYSTDINMNLRHFPLYPWLVQKIPDSVSRNFDIAKFGGFYEFKYLSEFAKFEPILAKYEI